MPFPTPRSPGIHSQHGGPNSKSSHPACFTRLTSLPKRTSITAASKIAPTGSFPRTFSLFPSDKIHHLTICAVLNEPKNVTTEADGLLYSHSALFAPLVEILNDYFPNLEISIRLEHTLHAVLQANATPVDAERRVDLLVEP